MLKRSIQKVIIRETQAAVLLESSEVCQAKIP